MQVMIHTMGFLKLALSKNISRNSPRNCRSLGCARDDKAEGRASIRCDGSNDSLTDLVHSSLNLRQASQYAPYEQRALGS
jgi:hypothetical protein